jgi:hypothetical protein
MRFSPDGIAGLCTRLFSSKLGSILRRDGDKQ